MRIYPTRSAKPAATGRNRPVPVYRYALALFSIGVFLVTVMAPTRTASDADELGLVDLDGIPDSILSRPRVVVLEIDSTELSDMLANPLERGRRWERPGHAAFLSNGEITLRTPVGVRIHGRSSRYLPVKSLRFYFRHSLGAVDPTGAEVGLTDDRRYQSLILHADVRADTGTLEFHYSNSIAYAIANRLGMMTPDTEPASFVLNGGPPHPYVITEHLSRDFLRDRLASRSLDVYNVRDAADRARLRRAGPLAELQARFGPMAGWTLERVSQVVDVDNLSRWFMTVLFCGTLDTAQGILVRDSRRASGQWYWIAWDMDVSFGRLASIIPTAGDDFHFRTMLRSDGRFLEERVGGTPDPDARVILLRHLLTASEPYRRQFVSLFVAARDSLLTPGFIDETLAVYERAAAQHAIPDTRDRVLIRAYLERRPAALQEQFNRYLGTNLP